MLTELDGNWSIYRVTATGAENGPLLCNSAAAAPIPVVTAGSAVSGHVIATAIRFSSLACWPGYTGRMTLKSLILLMNSPPATGAYGNVFSKP